MKTKFLVLIVIITLIGISLFILKGPEIPRKWTVEESRAIAENFIKNSPTCRFDGFNLRYVETITLRCPFCWEFVFEFKSRHSGYGDRTGKILLEVITEHRARVVVDHGKVISAILDDRWDELNQRFLIKEVSLTLNKDIYSIGEKVQFTFNPGEQKIYSGGFRGLKLWDIYKFEDNDWKPIPTGMLFGCRVTECINDMAISMCVDPAMIECHEISESISNSWDQKYWTTEERICGNQTYEFDVLSQAKPGRYKIRYNYAIDPDCENYSYVENEFMIEENIELIKSLVLNNEFNLTLDANPTTGYTWEAQFDKNILELKGKTFEPSSTGLLGAGGKEKFTFVPIKPGETTVTMRYKRPWENYSIEEKKFRFKIIEEKAECQIDSDCGIGGCSGQVCTTAEKAREIITTCEMRAEYECLKLTTCGCVDGKCQWRENSAYRNCINKLMVMM